MHMRNPKLMLVVLFGTAFVSAFNENIVNVGLADIMAAFAIDANTANWLVTGYMIVSAVVITATAFLQRRFGLRKVFIAASVLFVAGSALALIAPSFAQLLACRLVQAAGTGMFFPLMMGTVLAVADKDRIGTYLAIGGCCITLGPAFGPVVSGFMVTAFGWRAMFIVPCVAMAALFAVGLAFVYDVSEPERVRIDAPSVLLSALGLTLVVYGLSQIMASPLSALIAVSAGVAVIALFVRRQKGLDIPFLNLGPFLDPAFRRACLLVVVAMMTTFSMSVLLPLYFVQALGESAFVAGLLILPPIALSALTSLLGGRIMDRKGEWPLLPAGFAIIVVGQLAVALLAGTLEVPLVVLAASITYAGVGLVFSPSQASGLKGLSPELHAHGVSIINTLVMMAAALGPSLFVGVYSGMAASAADMVPALAQAQGFSAAVGLACAIGAIGFALSLRHALVMRDAPAAQPVKKVADAPVHTSV